MNINQETSNQNRGTVSSPPLIKFGEEIISQYTSQNDGNLLLNLQEINHNSSSNGEDYKDRSTNTGSKEYNNDTYGSRMPTSAENRGGDEGDLVTGSIRQSGIRGIFIRENITQNEISKQNEQKKLMKEIWESQINEKKKKKEEEKLKDIEYNKREEEKLKREFERQLANEQNTIDMKQSRLNRMLSNPDFSNLTPSSAIKEKEQQSVHAKMNFGSLHLKKNEHNSFESLQHQLGNPKHVMAIKTDHDEQAILPSIKE